MKNVIRNYINRIKDKMGTIQEEYLIVQGVDGEDNIEIVDNWISKLPGEWGKLFFKCPTHSNSYITYFMNWDGSKEGWESSEKGISLRESFIQLLLDIDDNIEILHIKPKGEVFEEDVIARRKNADINELDSPCVVCGKFEEIDSGMCESCREEAMEHFKKTKSTQQKKR